MPFSFIWASQVLNTRVTLVVTINFYCPNQDTFESERSTVNNHPGATVINQNCPRKTETHAQPTPGIFVADNSIKSKRCTFYLKMRKKCFNNESTKKKWRIALGGGKVPTVAMTTRETVQVLKPQCVEGPPGTFQWVYLFCFITFLIHIARSHPDLLI